MATKLEFSKELLIQELEKYTQEIEKNPEVANNFMYRADINFKLEDYEAALSDITKAIELEKNNSLFYIVRGSYKTIADDFKGAMIDYNKAIELDDKNSNNYFCRANLKSVMGDVEGALVDYNLTIELNENHMYAYNSRGILKGSLGNDENFDMALKLDPNYAEVYSDRGFAKRRLGDYKGAMEDFNMAIKLDQNFVDAYFNRGVTQHFFGELERAIEDYDKVVELDETNATAYNNRGMIKRRMIPYDEILSKVDAGDIESFDSTFDEEITNIKLKFEDSINDLKKASSLEPYEKMYNNNVRNTEEMYEDFKFEIGLNPQTQTGYLVFADIMGWKGIWQKKDFNENLTLKTMLRIKHKIFKIETSSELKVNLISDTFVIFSDSLKVIFEACRILVESCLESNLLIRGAMAFGTYYNLDTVYVGPTVDEAASWHEKAEEVAIICTTSARLEIEKMNLEKSEDFGVIKHDVCTKLGKISTYVVDWYTDANKEKFMSIMNSTQVYPELYNKYNNTEKALVNLLIEKMNNDSDKSTDDLTMSIQ